MAVSERLQTRLNKIPNVTPADIAEWVNEALLESDITEEDNANAVLYLALALAYESIAGDAARFFSYSDGEESVNKTNVYGNYMELAKDARKKYRSYTKGGYASQTHVGRADKP